ncbi:hypothetical protein GB937_007906 [Aspergillus fischeri]|nr:hypothetical protein GB937_007906 [Aspergillus fischeri]
MAALVVATITVYTRSNFRVAELNGGYDSDLANDEVTFVILEEAMVSITCLCLTIMHPGMYLESRNKRKSVLCEDVAMLSMSFLNDYSKGAHPRLLEALICTNFIQQTGYDTNKYTREARQLLLSQLNATKGEVACRFVLSSTSADLISIVSCLRPYEAVVVVQTGYILDKESGTIEATGHKIVTGPGVPGNESP